MTQSVRDAGAPGEHQPEARRSDPHAPASWPSSVSSADNKRFAVGLATTFELLQSQRDLSRAQASRELRATIDYNQSLVDFEAVQIAPIR